MSVVLSPADSSAKLWDVQVVAEVLDCSQRHVYRLSDSGRMPAPVKLGSLVRWSAAAIREWIDRGCPSVRSMKGGAMTCKCNPCRCGLVAGEQCKAEALALLEARREVYVRRGRRALIEALLRSGTATADDVRELVELPKGINPKCFGSVPGTLARAGIIRQVGFAKTCRRVGHARPLSVWALADRAAAERWLRDHPAADDGRDDDGVQGFLFPLSPNKPTPAAGTVGAGMEV